MELEQSFELRAPVAEAWAAFHDIALLVECLPGARLTGPATPDAVPLRFDVRLGPIAAGFAGKGSVSYDEATHGGRFEGSATDPKSQSRVKGAARFALSAGAVPGTTHVAVSIDYTLSGALAQFGRPGIVKDLAAALTGEFAANLQARLGEHVAVGIAPVGADPASDAAGERPDSPSQPPAPRVAGPLSAWRVLAVVLRARWRRFFAWWRGDPAA